MASFFIAFACVNKSWMIWKRTIVTLEKFAKTFQRKIAKGVWTMLDKNIRHQRRHERAKKLKKEQRRAENTSCLWTATKIAFIAMAFVAVSFILGVIFPDLKVFAFWIVRMLLG